MNSTINVMHNYNTTVTYLECVNLLKDIILYYDYYYQGLEQQFVLFRI